MSDEAQFTVKLIDKVSGASRGASSALGRLMGSLRGTGAESRTMSAAGARATSQMQAGANAMGRAATRSFGATRSAMTGVATAARASGRTFSQQMTSAQQSATGFTGALGRLGSSLGSLFGGGGGAAGAGGGGLFSNLFGGGVMDVLKGTLLAHGIEKLAELGVEAAKTAGEFLVFGQNARIGFEALAKHGATADDLFNHARALATRFGLDLEDTTHTYQKFLALQFNPKSADQLIRMGADMRALGNTAEDVQGIMLMMGEVKSIGSLQGRQLLSLEQHGISGMLVREEIAKRMGVSFDQVNKLEREGKIKADLAIDAIEAAVVRKLNESALGDMGAKVADKSITGILGRFKALAEDKLTSIMERAAPGVTAALERMLGRFETFINSAKGQKWADDLADVVSKAAGVFDDLTKDDWDKRLVAKLSGLVAAVTPPALQIGVAIGEGIAEGIAKAVMAAVGAGGGIGGLIGAALGGVFGGIPGMLIGGAVGLGAGSTLEAIGRNLFGGGKEAGKQADAGLASGMGSGAASKAGAQLADSAIMSTTDALGVHSPSRVFAGIGADTASGYALGVHAGAGDVRYAGERMADAHVEGFMGSASAGALQYGAPEMSAAYGPEMASFGAPAIAAGAPMPAAGGGPVSVDITVNVNGAGGNAEEVAHMTAKETRRELEAFFRQLAMETG